MTLDCLLWQLSFASLPEILWPWYWTILREECKFVCLYGCPCQIACVQMFDSACSMLCIGYVDLKKVVGFGSDATIIRCLNHKNYLVILKWFLWCSRFRISCFTVRVWFLYYFISTGLCQNIMNWLPSITFIGAKYRQGVIFLNCNTSRVPNGKLSHTIPYNLYLLDNWGFVK